MPGDEVLEKPEIKKVLESIYRLQSSQLEKIRILFPTEDAVHLKNLTDIRKSLGLPPEETALSEVVSTDNKGAKGGRRTRKFNRY